MKLAVAILVLCALSVQGFPKHKSLPKGLTSFKPEHVLSYVKQMVKEHESRQTIAVENRANNLHCYQESSAALQDVAKKSEEGNQKCDNILSNAQSAAQSQLEKDRSSLDDDSKHIQRALGGCGSIESANEALDCYKNQGQQNISPVSSLSSQSRTFKRNYDNTLSIAKSNSDGCSYDVSAQSESISAQIFSNLNSCIATGIWEPIDIPELGPSDPTTSTESPIITEAPETTTTEALETTEESSEGTTLDFE